MKVLLRDDVAGVQIAQRDQATELRISRRQVLKRRRRLESPRCRSTCAVHRDREQVWVHKRRSKLRIRALLHGFEHFEYQLADLHRAGVARGPELGRLGKVLRAGCAHKIA